LGGLGMTKDNDNLIRDKIIDKIDQLDNELSEKIKIVLKDNSIQNKIDYIENLMDTHHLKIKQFMEETLCKYFSTN
jgi:hypothetical protein